MMLDQLRSQLMSSQMLEQIDLKKVLDYGRLAKAWLREAAGVQQDGHAFDLEKALDNLGFLNVLKDKVQKDPKSAELVKERKMMGPINLEQLSELPDGTLGRAYAEVMKALKSKPVEINETEVTDDTSYIGMRLRQTREMSRALAGFDHSPQGEVAFQAFLLAQGGGSLPAVSIALQIARAAVTDAVHTQVLMNELCKGWLAGLKSEPFFAIDWEAHWSTPISEMRRRYMHARQLEQAEAIFENFDEESEAQTESQEELSEVKSKKKSAKRAARPTEQ